MKKIIYKKSFVKPFDNQIYYISKDSIFYAKRFKRQLISKIKEISKNPLIYRQSIYFEDDSIRDLIFKGYIVVFRINKDTIEVFGFVKYRQKL